SRRDLSAAQTRHRRRDYPRWCGSANGNRPRASGSWPVSTRAPHTSAVGEEVLQQCAALGLEDPAAYLYTMVEPRIPYHVKKRADRAGLRIEGPADQSTH